MRANHGKKVAALFGTLVISAALSACNGEMSPSDMPFPTLPINGGGTTHTDDFQHQINGPNVDGTWKSTCVEDTRQDNRWDLITLTISGQNVTRLTRRFKDDACTQADSDKNETGRFRYTKNNSRGDFEVEYEFNMQNGYYFQYETYNLKGQTLYISNEIGGEGAANVLMSRDGSAPGTQPTGTPTATPTATPAPDNQTHVATIGDEVVYVGNSIYGKQTETYDNQGYDSSYRTWTVFHDIEPGASMGYDYYNSLWSTAQANDRLKNCASQGGTLETITVMAGTFQTCAINNGKSKIWYGNVPIWGYVKIVSNDGSYSSELGSYSWADSLTHHN